MAQNIFPPERLTIRSEAGIGAEMKGGRKERVANPKWILLWQRVAIFAQQTVSLMKNESFFQDVYEVVRLIPVGRATSYGAIAEYLGLKRGARMVGWAMNSCHGLDVPAHRVVNRNGLLTGKHHFRSNDEMQRLLEAEGVVVKNDQVQQFGQLLWEPAKEIIV